VTDLEFILIVFIFYFLMSYYYYYGNEACTVPKTNFPKGTIKYTTTTTKIKM